MADRTARARKRKRRRTGVHVPDRGHGGRLEGVLRARRPRPDRRRDGPRLLARVVRPRSIPPSPAPAASRAASPPGNGVRPATRSPTRTPPGTAGSSTAPTGPVPRSSDRREDRWVVPLLRLRARHGRRVRRPHPPATPPDAATGAPRAPAVLVPLPGGSATTAARSTHPHGPCLPGGHVDRRRSRRPATGAHRRGRRDRRPARRRPHHDGGPRPGHHAHRHRAEGEPGRRTAVVRTPDVSPIGAHRLVNRHSGLAPVCPPIPGGSPGPPRCAPGANPPAAPSAGAAPRRADARPHPRNGDELP